MSRDLHFSLDNLPARYRIQAANKLAEETERKITLPKQDEVMDGHSSASGAKWKGKRTVAPVRMKKSKDGMTKTEEQFNRDVLLGSGKFESITLNLPGGTKYTPDFLFEYEGKIYLVEVKGSYKLPTHGRSVMAFKMACSLYPMFIFMFAELSSNGKTWKIGTYQDGIEVSSVSGSATELHNMK